MPTTITHYDPPLSPIVGRWGNAVRIHLLKATSEFIWKANEKAHYLDASKWCVMGYRQEDPVDNDYMVYQEETNRREMQHEDPEFDGTIILVTDSGDTKLLAVEIPDTDDPVFDALARGKGAMPHADFGSW